MPLHFGWVTTHLRISTRFVLATALVSAVAASNAHASRFSAGEDASGKPAIIECIRYRQEVRYGAYGYDHWVLIKNQCEKRASCSVVTDVNPEPIDVRIEPKETREVLTFRGSPAQTFRAKLTCALDK